MSDALLIHPNTINNLAGILPQLGTSYLCAYAHKHGYRCQIIDCPGQSISHNKVIEKIEKLQLKVITHPHSGWLDGCEQPQRLPL